MFYCCKFLSGKAFEQTYQDELQRMLEITKGNGSDYYRTQPARVSKRFAGALILSALEGQALHRDAFQFLGVNRMDRFKTKGHDLFSKNKPTPVVPPTRWLTATGPVIFN